MNHMLRRERVYPLKLTPEVMSCYRRYAHWLRDLLERLGH